MVQSTDLREGVHPSEFSPLNAPPVRGVLVERQMRARTVVVASICGKDPRSLTLVENDEVIQALATEQSDEALCAGVLPERPRDSDERRRELGDGGSGRKIARCDEPTNDRPARGTLMETPDLCFTSAHRLRDAHHPVEETNGQRVHEDEAKLPEGRMPRFSRKGPVEDLGESCSGVARQGIEDLLTNLGRRASRSPRIGFLAEKLDPRLKARHHQRNRCHLAARAGRLWPAGLLEPEIHGASGKPL